MVRKWLDKLVAGYVRSRVRGEDRQLSVSAQKQVMEQYAAEAGGQVSDWYVDEADGRSMERPALQRLLAAAQSGERAFDVVLVGKWSRLSRSAEDLRHIEATLRESGVEVVSVSEPRDSHAVERFIRYVTQASAEFYRECHSEDTRRGIAHARRMRGF